MTISSNAACSALLRRASPASFRPRSVIYCRSDRSRRIDTWSTSVQIPPRLTWICGTGQARRRWRDRSAPQRGGEDVVQDALVRAVVALQALEKRGVAETPPLRPSLFRIAANRALDRLRGRDVG